jgi:SAM-dependent methyltransferase
MKLFRRNGTRLTADAVRRLYREHLGREVESENAVIGHLNGHRSVESLRQAILESPEYHSNNLGRRLWCYLGEGLYHPAPDIEVEIAIADLEALFDRIANQWSTLGETDAHWSVLTNDKYRALAFPAHAEEFYLSGRHTVSLVDVFARRNNAALDLSHVLELGCGTGRTTTALAETFAKVTAVDVSAGHLNLCREALEKAGRSDADFVRLESAADARDFPACSFFFSVIVLQHNPPPLAHWLLDQALSKVVPGGAALFQVPTHFPEYSFRIADYLASPMPPTFEMHCLPMHCVFRLLQKHGFTPLEVVMDTWTGLPGSHTFFAVKS